MIPWLLGGAGLVGGGLAAFSGVMARKAEAAVPRDGALLNVGGNRLHYVDKGSGPAILFVHGLGGQMRNLARSVVDDLARDHRVVLVDRPGSGYSTRAPGASARLGVQAETIAGLIEMLKLDRPLLVGHSLGGAVSLAVALNHPQAISGLALLAPLTQVMDDPPGVFGPLNLPNPIVRRALAWTVATPAGLVKGAETTRMIFAPEPVPDNFGTDGGGLLSLRPNNFYEASTDMLAINDDLPGMVARYGSLNLPVDIFYGREDAILDYRLHGERTASEIPGAQLEVITGGHMIPFTKPDETLRFLRRAAGRRGTGHGDTDRG